jgi:hypothetical protein
MAEKINKYPGDWRKPFAQDIFRVINTHSHLNDTSLRFIIPSRKVMYDARIQSVLPPESLFLASIQHLYGLAQNSPLANELLGLNLTRGRHTYDTARLAAIFFTDMADATPEIFAQVIKDYPIDTDRAILHIVEYMRLHDAASLAFTAAMHGKVRFAGDDYNEDIALKAALREEKAYQVVTDLIYDKATQDYYKAKGIDKNIVLQIANVAIAGKTLLAQILKAPGIDWISYTTRDFDELMCVFNIDDQLPFLEIAKVVIANLQGVSKSLAANFKPILPMAKNTKAMSIEQIVPLNFIEVRNDQGVYKLVYNAKYLYELYVKHMILRLYFSGAPWKCGIERVIQSIFLTGKNSEELIKLLMEHDEKSLLNAGLRRLSQISLMGWYFSSQPNELDLTNFTIKKMDEIFVDTFQGIRLFSEAFPELIKLKQIIDSQGSLYLYKKYI